MQDYDRIVDLIRKSGERLTIQRKLVLDALTHTNTHMTINAVRDYIQQQHQGQIIPEPTIYRILQWLKDMGVVSQTDMSEDGIVYEIMGVHPHHHLICLNCGRTVDIDNSLFDGLRQNLQTEYKFHARIDHMAIYGYCEECAPDP